ncbi:DUF3127 domain-containing protein [Tenuifilum thalassicum]|uniref:DUF3127 domain-containing protein n=1 Tax=Tenuifilum thalassicum TaxID=2590900 RepID=A0A7D4BD65_9BACT|nr:DUF3127 domain-containing protein [Tenuifilum thalassicum]QKG79443.1 DUF3127 domain-containing protein [Tenuifilum thalassicum]
MEIKGKLIKALDQQSGQGKNGTWVKQEFIIETQEQYPRKVCISLWGDKVKELESIQVGDLLTASINIESREYNGRWYTDIRAWRIVKENVSNDSSVPPDSPPFNESDFPDINESDEDFPF